MNLLKVVIFLCAAATTKAAIAVEQTNREGKSNLKGNILMHF